MYIYKVEKIYRKYKANDKERKSKKVVYQLSYKQ